MTFKPTPENLVRDRLYKNSIPGLIYCDAVIHPDDRGFFAEKCLVHDLEAVIKVPFQIKQINLAHSKANVIRGFHAEGWNKLVTVIRGQVLSVLVDLREDSPTFGKSETFLLGEGKDQLKGCLYIPIGIANSVCVLEGPADYLYFVDRLYRDRDKAGDQAISLYDPDLKVDWPIPREKMIVSERDLQAVTLRQKFPHKF